MRSQSLQQFPSYLVQGKSQPVQHRTEYCTRIHWMVVRGNPETCRGSQPTIRSTEYCTAPDILPATVPNIEGGWRISGDLETERAGLTPGYRNMTNTSTR